MHYEYPKLDAAIESGKVVLKAITGSTVDRNELVHCSYVVIGFGLGTAFPLGDPPAPSGLRTSVVAMSPADLETQLKEFTGEGAKLRGAVDLKSLPWLQIALAVWEFVQKFLKK